MDIHNPKTRILSLFLFITVCVVNASFAMDSSPEFNMPFGLSMAPETRVVDFAKYKVGDIQEMNGVLATKKTAKEVVSFYEAALKAKGFRVFSKTDNAKRIYIAAKRGKGDFFSISNWDDDYGLEPGETTKLRITIRLAQ